MAFLQQPAVDAVYMKILLALLWCGFLMAAVPSLSPPANQISRHSHPHNRHGSKRPTPASTNNATSTTTSASVDGVTHAPPLLQRPFADCDYFQNLVPDKLYDIYSPGYEAATVTDGNTSYAPNTQCRWLAVAPKEHTIRLQCEDVALPKSTDCRADRLEISGAGRADLADAQRFCGVGSFVSDSNSNKLAIALRTMSTSIGGHFRCRIAAARLPPGTTQYCECGRRNRNRIVGGVETGVNEFPMMAGLIMAPTVAVYCGATIIARNYAVTAAHCLTDRQVSEIGLLVGDHNYLQSNDSSYAALYRIASTIIHSRYNVTSGLNDIALVRTSAAMTFNAGVSAVCLPFKYAFWQEQFVNATVEALGWGTQEFGGPLSPYLQEVALTVIANEQCTPSYPAGQITPAQLCTYRPNRDTCQSDSGGPLLFTDRSNYLLYLVGTVAYGNGCASSDPGVNMRTTSYVGWIQAQTPGVVYCFR